MPNFDTTIHIIGEPQNGIVIVTFSPFKVLTIGWDSIRTYDATIPDSSGPEATYNNLCYALTALVLDLGEGETTTLVDRYRPPLIDLSDLGVRINNADLCLSSKIDANLHSMPMGGGIGSRRYGYQMFHQVIDAILDPNTPIPKEIVPVSDEDYHDDGHGGDGGGGHDHDHDHDH